MIALAVARVARVPWWRRLLARWRSRGAPTTRRANYDFTLRLLKVPHERSFLDRQFELVERPPSWSRDVPMPRPPTSRLM